MAPPEPPAVHRLEIAADHPAFDGHFPGMPIFPGAALLDAALGIIEADLGLNLAEWQIMAAKFQTAVHPGDVLALEHCVVEDGRVRFAVRRSGRPALTGTLSRIAGGSPDDP